MRQQTDDEAAERVCRAGNKRMPQSVFARRGHAERRFVACVAVCKVCGIGQRVRVGEQDSRRYMDCLVLVQLLFLTCRHVAWCASTVTLVCAALCMSGLGRWGAAREAPLRLGAAGMVYGGSLGLESRSVHRRVPEGPAAGGCWALLWRKRQQQCTRVCCCSLLA